MPALMTVYDRMRLEGVSRSRPVLGPKSVNIHITSACDRKCAFCWYFSSCVSRQPRRTELKYAALRSLLEDCAAIGVETINLEGGEVTLHSRAADIFRLVHRLGMRLEAYTHLAYPKDRLSYLSSADRLTVNLSAASEERYRQVHGADGFLKVMSNLELVRRIRQKHGKPHITLTFIIYKHNLADIIPFLSLAERFGVDRAVFRLFKATEEMKALLITEQDAQELEKIIVKACRARTGVQHNLQEIRRVLRTGNMFRNEVTIPRSPRHNDRLFFYNNTDGKPRCYVAWFYAFVDEKGRVIAPCDNVGVCVAGNIYRRSFKDIWTHSVSLRRIRREAACGIDTAQDRWIECRNCGHASFNAHIAKELSIRGKNACF